MYFTFLLSEDILIYCTGLPPMALHSTNADLDLHQKFLSGSLMSRNQSKKREAGRKG